MKTVTVILLILSHAPTAFPSGEPHGTPAVTDRETIWSAYLAVKIAGQAEYRLCEGSRVDVLTESTAWEVEWAYKWEQSIGQALFYGLSTNKRPGVWLLKKSNDDDEDLMRCQSVVTELRKHRLVDFRVTDTRTGKTWVK